jgi:hypothetical protein
MIGVKFRWAVARRSVTRDKNYLFPLSACGERLGVRTRRRLTPPVNLPARGEGDVQRSQERHKPAVWKIGRQLKRSYSRARPLNFVSPAQVKKIENPTSAP